MKLKHVLLSFLYFFSVQLIAQQKTITGVVFDDQGISLPGATVLVENSNRGVTTGKKLSIV